VHQIGGISLLQDYGPQTTVRMPIGWPHRRYLLAVRDQHRLQPNDDSDRQPSKSPSSEDVCDDQFRESRGERARAQNAGRYHGNQLSRYAREEDRLVTTGGLNRLLTPDAIDPTEMPTFTQQDTHETQLSPTNARQALRPLPARESGGPAHQGVDRSPIPVRSGRCLYPQASQMS
jgi:hypothetical protein